MPFITLHLSGSPDPELSRDLSKRIGALACKLLRKDLRRTSVLVRYVPHADWFIADQSLQELGRNAFRLEVTVTDETNTRDEKATFQREAFQALSTRIGNVHPHSNIHVIDCRATAYGYGGVTQDRHYQGLDLGTVPNGP